MGQAATEISASYSWTFYPLGFFSFSLYYKAVQDGSKIWCHYGKEPLTLIIENASHSKSPLGLRAAWESVGFSLVFSRQR